MEGRYLFRDSFYDFRRYCLFLNHPFKDNLVRNPFHLDRVLDYPACSFDAIAVPNPRNRRHPEVNIRGEAPVQTHLFLAKIQPLFNGREIQESEVNRLFYLVRVFIGEEYIRDVSLKERNLATAFRVRGRLKKRFL